MIIIFAVLFVITIGVGPLLLSNIAFIPLLFLKKKNSLSIRKSNELLFFLFFLCVCIVSTLAYAIQFRTISPRTIIQVIFNFQYAFWLMRVQLDYTKIEKWIIISSTMWSLYIIFLFFKLGMYTVSPNVFFSIFREWAVDYIPNWPNDTGLPLLFAIFLICNKKEKKKYHYIVLCIISFALLSTTSRVSIFGLGLIICYFVYFNREKDNALIKSNWLKILIGAALFAILVFIVISIMTNPELGAILKRFTSNGDRNNILEVCLDLISKKPFLGYGSHTLDEVLPIYGKNYILAWPHTHNTVLELLIRYGILGMLPFMGMLICQFKKIKATNMKLAWLFFWFISLFQIYFRTFTFIFIIFYFLQADQNEEYV